MALAPRRLHYSLAEYLALEEESSTRHEYWDGEIYAMAGGTPDHAALAATALRLVGSQLPRGRRAFTSDLRVRIENTGLSTYPDGAVVCGNTQRSTDDPIAVVNPVLVIEVTSRSTEEYDQTTKLNHYQSLVSLQQVLIISHRVPLLTLHRREQDGSWCSVSATSGESITLACTGAPLHVDDVYADGLEDSV